MGIKVPFTALDRQYATLRDELREATDHVYSTGQMLDGMYTLEFENAIKERTDRKYAVAVNSCTNALLICYLHYAIPYPNRNVALPAYSFVATGNAPRMIGWNTKFVDVDGNGMIDLSLLDAHRDKLDIISYVNLYGNILDYDKLKIVASFFNDLVIIEDAAQSFGASYKGIPSGKLGDASVLSFDPTKNLPNYGSGGMILTDDRDLFTIAVNMRDNGKESRHSQLGINAKMSEADCAQMLVKLKHFDKWQERRHKIAQFYTDCLHVYADFPAPNEGVVHAWHKYVIKTVDQYELRSYLNANGIETKIHYDTPLPSMVSFMNVSGLFPQADLLAQHSVSLPIYPEMTDLEVEHVVKTLQKFYD